jgi:uncharacterized DUF497 family protein
MREIGTVLRVVWRVLVVLLLLVHIQMETGILAAVRDGGTGTLAQRPSNAWNDTWTDRLKKDLLFNYDKYARPAQHTNTTVVNLFVIIRHVSLDELKSIMTVQAWVRMTWEDEKLKWNESEYGGLSVLHVAEHEIWQPDIVLFNSATGNLLDHYGNTYCIARSNGAVLWIPPSQFQVFCNLDMRKWPFDTQSCSLSLGSWMYDGDRLDILLDSEGSELALLETNSEWQVVEVRSNRDVITYACCEEPYIEITYNLTLRRQSATYNALVITPATIIVLLTLATFWLPPTAGEKILLNGCTTAVICIYLLYFSQKLPAMAGHTPCVVLFYSSSLYMVCIATIVSVLVVNLARNHHVTPVPWLLKNLLTGWLGQILCLGHVTGQASSTRHSVMYDNAEELREQQAVVLDDHDHMSNSSEDRQTIIARSKTSSQHDWVLLAVAIDRITFLIYCLIFTIFATVYAV